MSLEFLREALSGPFASNDKLTDDLGDLQACADKLLQMFESGSLRTSPPVGQTRPALVPSEQQRFLRDPNVVAWVLNRAEGFCEVCGSSAPFLRSDGRPYLEVHHLRPLAKAGPDTVDNAVGCCPNCHRELHYGANPEEITAATIRRCSWPVDYSVSSIEIA